MIKKIRNCAIVFLAMLFLQYSSCFCQEAEDEQLKKVIKESLKQAIIDVDEEKSKQKAAFEQKITSQLKDFADQWVLERKAHRQLLLNKKIEQSWQSLLSTPPQHLDYYLRAFNYNKNTADIVESESISYPYTAQLSIDEYLFVERAPLIAEPRSKYQFTVHNALHLNLQYDKMQGGWQLTNMSEDVKDMKNSWPDGVQRKLGTYFIPA
jgi:hypothetical protein